MLMIILRTLVPRHDIKEGWRNHLDEMISQHKSVRIEFPSTESSLLAIKNDMHEVMEKVAAHEDYLNSKFADLSKEYSKVCHESLT